jgi:signal transduction histidine kinase
MKSSVEIIVVARSEWASELGELEESIHVFANTHEACSFAVDCDEGPCLMLLEGNGLSIYAVVPELVRILEVNPRLDLVIYSTERAHWDLIWERFDAAGRVLICGEAPSAPSVQQFIRFHEAKNRQRLSYNSNLERSESGRMEAIGHLAAGVAHELGTPVQYAMDSAYFLTSAWQGLLNNDCSSEDLTYFREEVPAALERLNDGLLRISELLGSMRDLAPREAEEEFEVVDLSSVVKKTLKVARGTIRANTDLRTALSAEAFVSCQPSRMASVILNTVINAVHAIEESGREDGLITVSTRERGRWVILQIEDNGCGIPTENRKKIFDLFFTTKPVGVGTGQGLALVQSIVKRHGGRIAFTSNTGVRESGTKFQLYFPRHQRSQEVYHENRGH